MKGALEGDDPEPVGLAAVIEMAARHLDRAFQRLGAGIAEEGGVGEGVRDQPVGELLLRLDAVEVRAVPELLALLLERRDQVRMGVAQQRHGDARAEIQIASPVAVEQIGAFAALEFYGGALVDRQERRHGGVRHVSFAGARGNPELADIARPCQRLVAPGPESGGARG